MEKYPEIIGRMEFLAKLEQLVDAGARFLTLHGPGGIGKSAIARVFAAQWQGAEVVDLDGYTSLDRTLGRLAVQLGVRPAKTAKQSELVTRVGKAIAVRGRTLIVLDNVEALVTLLRPVLQQWMTLAPFCTFIVTSRRRPEVPSERVLEVSPLRVPTAGMDEEDIRGCAAIQMLRLCGQRVRAGFELKSSDLADAVKLVQQLDGIPLAIELAAGRLDVMSLAELAGAVSASLEVVSNSAGGSDRQGALLAVVENTWSTLDPEEAHAAAQLSVFRGGFSLRDASFVVRTNVESVDIAKVIQGLRRKSIIREVEGTADGLRFEFYHVVHRYAVERLQETGTRQATLVRHGELFREREHLDSCDIDNLISAAHAVLALGAEYAALAADLVLTMNARGKGLLAAEELSDLCERAVGALEAVPGESDRLAGLYNELAHRRWWAADFDGSYQASIRARDAAQQGENALAEAEALCTMSLALCALERFEEASEGAECALAIARAEGSTAVAAQALERIGGAHQLRHDLSAARGAYEEALDEIERGLVLLDRRDAGVPQAISQLARLKLNVAMLCNTGGDYALAIQHASDAAPLASQLCDERLLGASKLEMGAALFSCGRQSEAVECLREAAIIFDVLGARYYEGWAFGWLCLSHTVLGDWSDAVDCAGRCIDLIAQGPREDVVFFRAVRAVLSVEQGDVSKSRWQLEHARREASDDPRLRRLLDGVLSDIAATVELAGAARDRDHPRLQRLVADARELAGEPRDLDTELRRASRYLLQHYVSRGEQRCLELAPPATALVVDADSNWFKVPGEESPVRLDTRAPLRAVLRVLTEHHSGALPGVVESEALIRAAWPDLAPNGDAAKNRLAVALSTLRGLGLREYLVRSRGGYRIDPSVPIVVSSKDPSP